jgi:hypothetical protein
LKKYIIGDYYDTPEREKAIAKKKAYKAVVETLRSSYPYALTPKKISEKVNKNPAFKDVNLNDKNASTYAVKLVEEGFAIHAAKGQNNPDVKRMAETYAFEDLTFTLNKKQEFKHQFAPGNVNYDNKFLDMYNLVVHKEDKDPVHTSLVRFIETIFKNMRFESDKEIVSHMTPETKEEFCCRSEFCGLNHEVRDFIRATFLHLIDDLETNPQFIKFLYDNEFVTQEAYKHIQKGYSIEDEVKDRSSRQQNIPATLQSTSPSSDIKIYIEDINHIDQLIKMFAKSPSYHEARKRCKEVLNFTEQINEKQVNDIALAIMHNGQILSLITDYKELKDLKSFLKERKDQILPETIQKLEYWRLKILEND